MAHRKDVHVRDLQHSQHARSRLSIARRWTMSLGFLLLLGSTPTACGEAVGGHEPDQEVASGGRMGTGGVACFAGETLVATPHGAVSIADLTVGDTVWSFHHPTQRLEPATVNFVRSTRRPVGEFSNQASQRLFRATSEHPIFDVDSQRYSPARLWSPSGSHHTLTLATGWESPPVLARAPVALATDYATAHFAPPGNPRETVTVYDIGVDGNHNFFAEGVLVHNKSPSCLSSPGQSWCQPSTGGIIDIPSGGTGTGGGCSRPSSVAQACSSAYLAIPDGFVSIPRQNTENAGTSGAAGASGQDSAPWHFSFLPSDCGASFSVGELVQLWLEPGADYSVSVGDGFCSSTTTLLSGYAPDSGQLTFALPSQHLTIRAETGRRDCALLYPSSRGTPPSTECTDYQP